MSAKKIEENQEVMEQVADTTKSNTKPRRSPGPGGKNGRFNSGTRVNTYNGNRSGSTAVRRPRTSKHTNHISWWASNSGSLDNVARLPFSEPTGVPLRYPSYVNLTPGLNNLNMVPGIMALDVDMNCGISENATSPTNIALQYMYTQIRKATNKRLPYQRADVGLVVMAMANFYAMWNYAKRVYCIINKFSVLNRYLPIYLCSAMRVDYEDISRNAADFRFKLNNIAKRADSLTVPTTIPLFARQSWMMSNVFKDSSSDKAQLYVFVPNNYYVYDESSSDTGAQLQYTSLFDGVPAGRTLLKAEDIINILENMLNRILDSEDIALISGDILGTFGKQTAFLSEIPEIADIDFVYDEAVLSQIHNATILPRIPSEFYLNANKTWSITQDPNNDLLIYSPYIINESVPKRFTTQAEQCLCECMLMSLPVLLNSRFDAPTATDNMISSRLICKTDVSFEGSDQEAPPAAVWKAEAKISTMSVDFIRGARIISMTKSSLNQTDYITTQYYGYNQNSNLSLSDTIQLLTGVTTFDWAPVSKFYTQGAFPVADEGSTINLSDVWKVISLEGMLCDVNNYLQVDDVTLHDMNLLAVQNVWGLKF